MKLYYLPGSCALGPHIALEYSGLAYEAVRVERGRQTDPTYLAINPLGRVPTLVTATHGTITEAPIVLTYIADVATDHGLLPAVGTPERYDALRWMAYVSTTVHPALGRLWRAERFCDGAGCESAVERAAAEQLANDFAYIERHMSNRQWVAGNHLTVADFHLFVFGRLGLRLPTSTRDFPNLHRHTLEIASLPATQSAMAQQGITLEGPASGPG
jgi:glutathione S-transferase